MIDADATRLEQVFLNLALNGLAAMTNGGTLEFSVSQDGENLRIEARDTGMGIPAEIQPRIFDPYFTTRSEGTGMGLALSDKFIRQQDGNTDFESNPQGTRFTVSSPNLQT